MDKFSLIGLVLGMFAIFGGAVMEGVHLTSILIPTAAIIVFGGTIGAILLQSSAEEIHDAKALVGRVFKEKHTDTGKLVDRSGLMGRRGRLARSRGATLEPARA